jgi:hypothetical protein
VNAESVRWVKFGLLVGCVSLRMRRMMDSQRRNLGDL